MKQYLDELSNLEEISEDAKAEIRTKGTKEWFPYSEDFTGDLERAFELWDRVSLLSSTNTDLIQCADVCVGVQRCQGRCGCGLGQRPRCLGRGGCMAEGTQMRLWLKPRFHDSPIEEKSTALGLHSFKKVDAKRPEGIGYEVCYGQS